MKKQLINEAFRLQQLAGIQPLVSLKEEYEDMSDEYKDDFEPINSDMSNIKPGDGIVSGGGYFAEFKGVTNKGKYLVIFDDYGEKGLYSKDNFIKRFRVQKKK